MKILPSLLLISALLFVGCGKPDLEDPDSLNEILESALDMDEIQFRGKKGEMLVYALNSQKTYTGSIKKIHENGQVSNLINFKDGKEHGLDTSWYDSGQKESEGNYKEGVRHGPAAAWHENGQKMVEAVYKEGKLHGFLTKWYENGQKEVEDNYKEGEKHGPGAAWHENGQKMGEVIYKEGEPHGVVKTWDEKGNLIETKWENGKRVE